jgi:hypothetical protein
MSRRRSFLRPTVSPEAPHPTATSEQVEDFLIKVLLVQNWNIDRRDVGEIAHRCPADGEGLYTLPKGTMIQHYGTYGEHIYDKLHKGKYGYVS